MLVREIADAEQIPQPFLSKILHGLRAKGLVKSRKGPGGGFLLAKPPNEMKVTEIIEAVDGKCDLDKTCLLGMGECQGDHGCPLHHVWKPFRDELAASLAALTLTEVAEALAVKRTMHITGPAYGREPFVDSGRPGP
jgi:Rrf2 family protein